MAELTLGAPENLDMHVHFFWMKLPQDGPTISPRLPKIAKRMPRITPRWFKMDPRWFQWPRNSSEKPHLAEKERPSKEAVLEGRPRKTKMAPERLENGSRFAPRVARYLPEQKIVSWYWHFQCPRDSPRGLQNGSKVTQRRFQDASSCWKGRPAKEVVLAERVLGSIETIQEGTNMAPT